jgi:multiple sugar transport system ATP-binding protein
MSEIVLEHVTKEFPGGVVAVQDFSLEVHEGEFVVLVGPSGCGKSTTLRMVAGLEEVTSGHVRINGREVTGLPPRKRDIAMVFQNYALYAHMSVRDNIGFGLKMADVPKPDIRTRVDEAAEILGIVDLLDRKPRQLSGGQRQRVAMGRAIVREPAAFLMDEPLSNLDAKLRVEMRGEITNLQRRIATPTLYVTHDQTEAMTMGDRVAILRDGVLEQLGSPTELYETPVNVFVAGFIGSPAMNLLSARLEAEGGHCTAHVGDSRLSLPPDVLRRRPGLADFAGREVVLGIRPEDFQSADAARNGNHGLLSVTVTRSESLGSDVIAYFRLGEQPEGGDIVPTSQFAGAGTGLLTARLDRRTALADDRAAQVAVELDRLYFFDPETGTAIA